ILYINYLGAPIIPSIAENAEVMNRTIDSLAENQSVMRITLIQQKNYTYSYKQTRMLAGITELYATLMRQERILINGENNECPECSNKRNKELTYYISILKRDPVAAYYEIIRFLRELTEIQKTVRQECQQCVNDYARTLRRIKELMETTEIYQEAREYLEGYRYGERTIYSNIFRPDTVPNFTYTRLVATLPREAEIVKQYTIGAGIGDESTVTIMIRKNEIKPFYHLTPPEYSLNEEQYQLLNLARNVMTEHTPRAEEFTDPERTRQVFLNVAKDLLRELSNNKKIMLSYNDLNKLANILVRHTIGFGILEVLLQDENLQDIVINAPASQNPIFLRHAEFDECETNIIPSQEDTSSWAAKFRIISGRPLDEANPILDTDLTIKNSRARVAIIQEPLSPNGLAYAFRRHRDKPWTLPLFIKNKMINPLTAGILSFLIDGSRTLLVAGTRSSGKSSLLGALMLEIMSKYRMIVLEDSVTGDSKIMVKKNNNFINTTMGELIDEEIKNNGSIKIDGREKTYNKNSIKIFSADKNGKIVLAEPSRFIRHKTKKTIYEVTTTSGRKIKVTGDHSLFTIDEKNILKPTKVKDLKENNYIAIPSVLPFDNHLKEINLLEHSELLNKKIFVLGEEIERYIKKQRKELYEIAYSLGYKKPTIQNWIIKKILPIRIFNEIKEKINDKGLMIKSYGGSNIMPSRIKLDEKFLNFIGLWLADGCYDRDSIIISVQEEENKEVIRTIAKRLNLEMKKHSDNFSTVLNFSLLKEVMKKVLKLDGNSHSKKIPGWAYNLSNKQVGWLLKGFYSGDGCASDKEIIFSIRSKKLAEEVSLLLLRLGITTRNSCNLHKGSYLKEKKEMFTCRIGATKLIRKFQEQVGFLVRAKQEKLNKLARRTSTHDATDIIPLSFEMKKELRDVIAGRLNWHDYLARGNNLGREHLGRILKEFPKNVSTLINSIKKIINSDISWDKVKQIRKVKSKGYVYDISVPKYENFISENIVAHNTLELPVEEIRKLGYDILRMKVRSALLEKTTEVSADEGIRTSLRLGDSSLIVGEVRSVEARALYEAMRVGALANTVAGTIHGASAYGVFDRVVNDLGVPATSFKATDVIIVANPVKSPDGIKSFKRMIQLTEVRKHWTEDPIKERGFVDLLRYDVEKDELVPTDELMNGESEIIKDIAAGVRGWAGNWDAVWDNIILRGKIKEEIVKASEKHKMPELLEAEFNVLSNMIFHKIAQEVTEEKGLPLSKEVLPKWKEWMEESIKEMKKK
ncbi:hypothetical protein COU61_02160, partial [Candidatus Pacearchaeota archaeon CG10_big_fil_rev_8_21_14_0_10_35_13]